MFCSTSAVNAGNGLSVVRDVTLHGSRPVLHGNVAPSLSWRQRERSRVTLAYADKSATSNTLPEDPTADRVNEDLAAKLAAAEAEAEALRRELEQRKTSKDLAWQTPSKSRRRVDGTGFRETIGLTRETGTGELEQQVSKWGLTEADLLSRGTGDSGLAGPAAEEGADAIVQRRLFIGLGLTAVTAALSTVSIPAVISRPTKPLFFYLVPLVELSSALQDLEKSEDVAALRRGLKKVVGDTGSIRLNLLNAAALLDDQSQRNLATTKGLELIQYLDQADYDNYYDTLVPPTRTQELSFLNFSLSSVKEASKLMDEFLNLMPVEAVQAAEQLLVPTSPAF